MGARTSRTSRTSRLVGLALAVLALATAAGCSGGGDRSAVTTGATGPAPPTGGLAVDLPPGWRTVEPYQPAHITEPVAVLALASGPGVRRARTACHVGGAYAIPDEVAVVVVLEWRWMDVSSDVPFPAPAALRATDLPLHRSGLECFAGRAGATQVETAGRAFGVYLMLGAAADGRTVEQALAAIRSLRTTTVPAPAGWRVVEDPVRGVAVALPPGWTRARRTLTPLLADPSRSSRSEPGRSSRRSIRAAITCRAARSTGSARGAPSSPSRSWDGSLSRSRAASRRGAEPYG